MSLNPGVGLSPFEAMVRLYDKSQGLQVELERHAETMAKAVEGLELLPSLKCTEVTRLYIKTVACETLATASRNARAVIAELRANREAKWDQAG